MARHTPPAAPDEVCDLCGAYVANPAQHVFWHSLLAPLLADPPRALADAGEDDYPTAKLPPVRETVLRRPPVPEVRELRGAALLRALADELAADDDGDEL